MPGPSALSAPCGSKLGQRHDASTHSQWEAGARVHVLSCRAWNTRVECLRENAPRDVTSPGERVQGCTRPKPQNGGVGWADGGGVVGVMSCAKTCPPSQCITSAEARAGILLPRTAPSLSLLVAPKNKTDFATGLVYSEELHFNHVECIIAS